MGDSPGVGVAVAPEKCMMARLRVSAVADGGQNECVDWEGVRRGGRRARRRHMSAVAEAGGRNASHAAVRIAYRHERVSTFDARSAPSVSLSAKTRGVAGGREGRPKGYARGGRRAA